MIRTTDRRLVPFLPNDPQVKYLNELCPDWVYGDLKLRGLREMILKARKQGFSTLIAATYFIDSINTPNTSTVVVSNDEDGTSKLFRMVQTFFEHLPPHKRPRTKYANRGEYFWPDLNSSYYVGTAGNRKFGRGDTINNLHCSEVAHWPDAEQVMTGLLQAVPDDGNVFQETTANGLGNFFHTEYQEAERGNSTYTARFFAWFLSPQYQWTPTTEAEKQLALRLEDARTQEDIDKEERLREAYHLSEAQLAWRRKKIVEPGMREKFVQEFPSNPKEAFIASGNPYFDREKLTAQLERLEAQPPTLYDPRDLPLEKLKNLRSGSIEIYKLPEPGRDYVIPADCSEGLTGDGDHDYDSADVLDAETWEQVAHLHGLWDTHEYGLMLAELGWFYNTALVAPERNNHGHAVINAILHAAGYPAMTDMEPSGLYYHADYDDRKDVDDRRPGWPTTGKSKTFALDSLATSIDEGDIWINSRETLGELVSYVKLPGGKSGGEGGSHDDRVISLAIGKAILLLRPRRHEYHAAVGGRANVSAGWKL